MTPDRLKAFLDDLALITAKHGIFVTAHDMWAHDLEPGFVGYAGDPSNEEIWERHSGDDVSWRDGCATSLDVSTITAHQRIAMERSLAGMREQER